MWTEWQRRRNMAWGAAGLLAALFLAAAPAVAALADFLDFSDPVTISNGTSGGAFSPQVAVTSGGRVYVAWIDGHDIRFDRYSPASGSCGGSGGLQRDSLPRETLPDVTGTPNSVAMAGNDTGVYVAWRAFQEDGSNYIGFSRSTDGGQTFVTRTDPLSRNASNMSDPSLAADSAGGVFVVWEENASAASLQAVQIAQFTDKGMTFRSTSTVFGRQFGFLYQPSVASTGSVVYVVWNDLLSQPQRILHKMFAPGDDPANVPFSSLTNEFAVGPMNPRIAAHVSQVTALWTEGGNIKARTMNETDGKGFGGEVTLYSAPNSSLGAPTLSVGGRGQFVAWPEVVQSDVLVRYALGTAVDGLASAGNIETFPWAPSAGQDGRSLFVAAWQEFGKDSNGEGAWQVKFSHTAGSGSSTTPMLANAYVRQPLESVLSGAQRAGDQGRVNVYVEFEMKPGNPSAAEIDPDTLKLITPDKEYSRLPGLARLGDTNRNGTQDLEVQFPRSAFAGKGFFTVKGTTKNGRCFTGTGTVKAKVKVDVKVRR